MIRHAAAAAVFAFAAALSCGPATAQERFSDAERDEIGGIVREYLLANPGLLEEVLVELEKKQAADELAARDEAIRDNADALFRSPLAHVAGNPDGDVTVVEFFDYNCGYCKRMLPDLIELVENDPEVRLVLREWPVLGPPSTEASRVAVAVLQVAPDSYFDFHVALMSASGRMDSARALDLAEEIGLDRPAIEAAILDPVVEDTLRESLELGNALDLRGTPAYVIDDAVMMGAVGLERLREQIAEVRDEGCDVC